MNLQKLKNLVGRLGPARTIELLIKFDEYERKNFPTIFVGGKLRTWEVYAITRSNVV